MSDDSRQAGADEPLGIPHYREAMQIILEWEANGDSCEEPIGRLYNLWVHGNSQMQTTPSKA